MSERADAERPRGSRVLAGRYRLMEGIWEALRDSSDKLSRARSGMAE